MFSFLRYPLRYAQICTLCLLCHLTVMFIKIVSTGPPESKESKQKTSFKIILMLSPDIQEFPFNQMVLQRFAVLNCTRETCYDMRDYINITRIDATIIHQLTPKIETVRRVSKYTIDSIVSAESQCLYYFNGFLNRTFLENMRFDYVDFKNKETMKPKNSVEVFEVTNPWWKRLLLGYCQKRNNDYTTHIFSYRSWRQLLKDRLDMAKICWDHVFKSRIVGIKPVMKYCKSLYSITS